MVQASAKVADLRAAFDNSVRTNPQIVQAQEPRHGAGGVDYRRKHTTARQQQPVRSRRTIHTIVTGGTASRHRLLAAGVESVTSPATDPNSRSSKPRHGGRTGGTWKDTRAAAPPRVASRITATVLWFSKPAHKENRPTLPMNDREDKRMIGSEHGDGLRAKNSRRPHGDSRGGSSFGSPSSTFTKAL